MARFQAYDKWTHRIHRILFFDNSSFAYRDHITGEQVIVPAGGPDPGNGPGPQTGPKKGLGEAIGESLGGSLLSF